MGRKTHYLNLNVMVICSVPMYMQCLELKLIKNFPLLPNIVNLALEPYNYTNNYVHTHKAVITQTHALKTKLVIAAVV